MYNISKPNSYTILERNIVDKRCQLLIYLPSFEEYCVTVPIYNLNEVYAHADDDVARLGIPWILVVDGHTHETFFAWVIFTYIIIAASYFRHNGGLAIYFDE